MKRPIGVRATEQMATSGTDMGPTVQTVDLQSLALQGATS